MSFVFFKDRDLGKQFPDILISAGLNVERHSAHFAPTCPDEEWLEEIGKREWVALTHNSRIRYTPNELAAVVRHRVRLLVIMGKARFADLAKSFVATAPRVEAFLERNTPPLIGKVYRPAPTELSRNPDAPGHVELWYP